MSAERGNGRLMKLWRILRHTIPYDADRAAQVVGLCLALSNYILDQCPMVDDILEAEDASDARCCNEAVVSGEGGTGDTDATQPLQGRNQATMFTSFLEG